MLALSGLVNVHGVPSLTEKDYISNFSIGLYLSVVQ